MASISMLAYRVTEMNYQNRMPDKAKLNLATQVSYRVRHTPAGVVQGEMKVAVKDKEKADGFSVTVSAVGIFRTEKESKETVHRETFRILFPHLRSLITTLTANAGIPPILLPLVDPEGENSLKVEFNPGGVPAGE